MKEKNWLTPKELEEEYGFSISWQNKARMISNNSSIPYSKIGKFIRYSRVAIEQWIEKHQVQG